MSAPVRRAFLGAVLVAITGCSTSPSRSEIDGGPPVPDPGGPFTTTVGANRPISALDPVEADTLCRDFGAAYRSFLGGAVATQNNCNSIATEVTRDSEFGFDGGFDAGPLDAGALCSDLYDACANAEPPFSLFECPIPIPRTETQTCDATVEDVSACLNEVAAAHPLGVCVHSPGCDAMPWLDASLSASSMDAMAPPASAFPACQRLMEICPVVAGWAAFPC